MRLPIVIFLRLVSGLNNAVFCDFYLVRFLVTGAFLSGLREAYRIFTFNDIIRKTEVKEEPSWESQKRLSDSVPDARMPKTRRLRSRHATSYAELDVDLDFQ